MLVIGADPSGRLMEIVYRLEIDEDGNEEIVVYHAMELRRAFYRYL